METGKVKWFNSKKHFGFITSKDGVDIFVHESDVAEGCEIKDGDSVQYDIGKAPKGEKAVNVRPL
jgi:cold shock protein